MVVGVERDIVWLSVCDTARRRYPRTVGQVGGKREVKQARIPPGHGAGLEDVCMYICMYVCVCM